MVSPFRAFTNDIMPGGKVNWKKVGIAFIFMFIILLLIGLSEIGFKLDYSHLTLEGVIKVFLLNGLFVAIVIGIPIFFHLASKYTGISKTLMLYVFIFIVVPAAFVLVSGGEIDSLIPSYIVVIFAYLLFRTMAGMKRN
jgi:hypothetical protein